MSKRKQNKSDISGWYRAAMAFGVLAIVFLIIGAILLSLNVNDTGSAYTYGASLSNIVNLFKVSSGDVKVELWLIGAVLLELAFPIFLAIAAGFTALGYFLPKRKNA